MVDRTESLSWCVGQVAVARRDRGVTVVDEVRHGDAVARHTDQGPFAQILGQPFGAPHGRRGIVALRGEASMRVSPQFAYHVLTRSVARARPCHVAALARGLAAREVAAG